MDFFDVHCHSILPRGIFNKELSDKLPNSYFSVGLHPKDINNDFQRNLEIIKQQSVEENCLAIGECGLDALVEVDEVLQEKIFEEQIYWANEIQKPVIVHCVRRFSQLLKFQKIAKVPLIVHGFNKKRTIAMELLNKGFYLSFGNALLYNETLQDLVRDLSIDKIFLETDTAKIEIKNLYQKLSEVKGISIEEIQNQINRNIYQVFKIKV